MADEASLTIVARMRDEASDKMKAMNTNVEQVAFSQQQLQQTLTATGGALTAVGSLMNMVGGEAGKTAAIFLTTAGAIMSTVGAIMAALPMIRGLITTLRSLAIVQTIVAALSGPVGWGKIAIGLGIAAAATAGVVAMANRGGGTSTEVNINSQAFVGNQTEARKFGRDIQTINREERRLGR